MQQFNESIEPDAIFNRDGSSAEPRAPQTLYWHVFGAPLDRKRAGKNNYATITAGPVPKGPDAEVRNQTAEGEHGAIFRYIGTFTHEPSNDEIYRLRPKEYR